MFSIFSMMFVTNLVLIPYYFTELFEFIILNISIPTINYIYYIKTK